MGKQELNILIIEDDLVIAENLKENLLELGYSSSEVVSSEKETMVLLDSGFQPDIVFADIDLGKGKTNGIQIVKKNDLASKAAIIFLTSFNDKQYIEEAKEIGVAAYLIKPASQKQIDVAIDLSISKKTKQPAVSTKTGNCPFFTGNEYFFIRMQNRYEKIYYKDIVYLKAQGSYCSIETKYKSCVVSMNLGKMLEHLQNVRDIIRCHKGFAINIDHIESFDNSSLFVLKGQEVVEIPISSSHREEIFGVLPRL